MQLSKICSTNNKKFFLYKYWYTYRIKKLKLQKKKKKITHNIAKSTYGHSLFVSDKVNENIFSLFSSQVSAKWIFEYKNHFLKVKEYDVVTCKLFIVSILRQQQQKIVKSKMKIFYVGSNFDGYSNHQFDSIFVCVVVLIWTKVGVCFHRQWYSLL